MVVSPEIRGNSVNFDMRTIQDQTQPAIMEFDHFLDVLKLVLLLILPPTKHAST